MTSTRDVEYTDHSYGSIIQAGGYEGVKWPMMITLIILSVFFFFGKFIEKMLASCCESLMIGDVGELDESIDNYWAALDDGDRKWSQREE